MTSTESDTTLPFGEARPPIHSALAAHTPNRGIVRGYRRQDLMRESSFADLIFLQLIGRLPSEAESRLFELILSHQGMSTYGNSSSQASRHIISTNPDQHAAMAGGLLAFGPYYAAATEHCGELARTGVRRMKAEARTHHEMATIIVEEHRKAGKRVPGIGSWYTRTDERAEVMFEVAQEAGFFGDHSKLYLEIAGAMPQNPRANLVLNAEGASAALLLDMLGDEFDTRAADLINILGRMVGLAAGVLEEQQRVSRQERRTEWVYDGAAERDLPEDYVQWRRRRRGS